MQIKQIPSVATIPLRNQILRPSRPESDCIYPGDDAPTTAHFAAYQGEQQVGIVSIYQVNFAEQHGVGYQIRAMATVAAVRGQGVGAQLLAHAEAYAMQHNADYIWANARASAQGFYAKQGYQIDQKVFEIKGVGPHHLATKTL